MMMRILLLLTLGLLLGCESNDDRVSVSGLVLVDDRPMQGVTVVFMQEGGSTMASTTTGSDGKFTARVAPGRNLVTLSKDSPTVAAPVSDDPEAQTMGTEEEVQAMMKNFPKQLIAPKFADPKTSGLSFDLQEGASVEIKATSQ